MSCLKSWDQSGDEKLLGTKCQRKIVEVLKGKNWCIYRDQKHI